MQMHIKYAYKNRTYYMAIPNLAVLETYLKDIIVSKESIITNVENRDHIFEIKDEEKTLGFISLYDLIEHFGLGMVILPSIISNLNGKCKAKFLNQSNFFTIQNEIKLDLSLVE